MAKSSENTVPCHMVHQANSVIPFSESIKQSHNMQTESNSKV